MRQLLCFWMLLCVLFICSVCCAQMRFRDGGSDPRERPASGTPPTQAVLEVEHIESRPLDPKYKQRADDIRKQLAAAVDDAERTRLQNALKLAEREAAKRVVNRYSGYIAVLAPGDGKFDDASPHPKYYLVGTLEVEPKDRDLIEDVKVGDYILVPNAIGGESLDRFSVFCRPSTQMNSKPRQLAGPPRWWVERDFAFAPPWEGVYGPVAIEGLLFAQLVPASGGESSKANAVTRILRVQNATDKPISKARIAVRILDESGVELCVITLSTKKTGESRSRASRTTGGQRNPELGKMAIDIEPDNDALVVTNIAPRQTVEVQIPIPQDSNPRAKRAQVFITYLDH